jgi:hypothetical protein
LRGADGVVAAAQVRAVQLLLQALDLALDKDARVGLGVEELEQADDDDGDDEDDPKVPTPADGLREPAAEDGADGRA